MQPTLSTSTRTKKKNQTDPSIRDAGLKMVWWSAVEIMESVIDAHLILGDRCTVIFLVRSTVDEIILEFFYLKFVTGKKKSKISIFLKSFLG